MKKILLLLFICFSTLVYSQQGRKMKILNADVTYQDEENPDVTISVGNVFVEIDGATIRCKRVEIYSKTNYLKARGDVVMNQGDTIIQTSKYADYDGNTKLAKSWGDVVLKDPTMTLTTETLHFDREKQFLYYKTRGVIKDTVNVLKSNRGNYYLKTNKFQALSKVVITNPDQVIETNHLDYYTGSGKAYLYKPSTITGDKSLIYTEKGFHDTKNKVSHLTKNSWIKYDDRKIVGDSIFYDENKNFSSATGNIIVTDTINNGTLKGNYGEFYRARDSAYITGRAVAISLIEKDSLYIHGDTLLLTGKPEERIIRAYSHVKFFKSDMSGKCDSLYTSQVAGITKMFRKPVLWSQENQITGDVIHFLHNTETEQLDSLKVIGNSFMVQKDSIGFNQTKGRDILGKFEDNDLKIVDVVGNGEVIHYVRNEEQELIGIMKMRCSSLNLTIDNQQIQTIEFRVEPDGKTYPEEELHVNDRKLNGLVWRIDEKPKSKDDIYIHDVGDDKIIAEERIKEKTLKLQAEKEAEEKRIRDLAAKELQKKQDSIAANGGEKIKIKKKKESKDSDNKDEDKIDIKKDE
jgi:lipopolysaccharide export system protein LptA